ncbi:hypothetical protein lerEdw1_008696 [Lerista edwardsae]|nr:hypothetical protein lerEdw1_008696 [Lerista edwardsae]
MPSAQGSLKSPVNKTALTLIAVSSCILAMVCGTQLSCPLTVKVTLHVPEHFIADGLLLIFSELSVFPFWFCFCFASDGGASQCRRLGLLRTLGFAVSSSASVRLQSASDGGLLVRSEYVCLLPSVATQVGSSFVVSEGSYLDISDWLNPAKLSLYYQINATSPWVRDLCGQRTTDACEQLCDQETGNHEAQIE